MTFKKQSDLKKALYIVWGIIAVMGQVLVLIPFIIDEKVLLKSTPVCTASLSGEGSCLFCGLTRGFIALSKGMIEEALLWNKFSLLIFLFFLINFIIFTFSLIYLKNK
tara:strand:+ start:20789 stop:21112 length:324 start_codon:yes stop_codon:yes gene_type:complete